MYIYLLPVSQSTANISVLSPFLCSQEDDIDGEHIVAFAEEDDPGTFLP